MMREYHVRICEGLGVQLPGSTRHKHGCDALEAFELGDRLLHDTLFSVRLLWDALIAE